jgi:hypothetical protein
MDKMQIASDSCAFLLSLIGLTEPCTGRFNKSHRLDKDFILNPKRFIGKLDLGGMCKTLPVVARNNISENWTLQVFIELAKMFDPRGRLHAPNRPSRNESQEFQV